MVFATNLQATGPSQSRPTIFGMSDLEQAHHYFSATEYFRALARLERYLTHHPGDCNARFFRVKILVAMGECRVANKEAIALLQHREVLYDDWIHYLSALVEQARPGQGNHTAARHKLLSKLPWEA